ncbi:Uncharacterized protein ALO86_01052 [Pseudomonas syringae pv. berberidis]|nr:Uncharacterized protein ALO86_01052 [Pseudomonas syringae pv. berberidis]
MSCTKPWHCQVSVLRASIFTLLALQAGALRLLGGGISSRLFAVSQRYSISAAAQMPSFRAEMLWVIAYRGALLSASSERHMINLHRLISWLFPDRRPDWEQKREREFIQAANT